MTTTKIPRSDEILDFIVNKYSPAESIQDADILLGHADLFTELNAFFPDVKKSSSAVFDSMKEAGFKYDEQGMHFFWLLKRK